MMRGSRTAMTLFEDFLKDESLPEPIDVLWGLDFVRLFLAWDDSNAPEGLTWYLDTSNQAGHAYESWSE